MYTFRLRERSDASYEEIMRNMRTHPKLKYIHACALRGSAFFLYKGCTRKVLSILPGGDMHVVHLKPNNTLLGIHTEPGVIHVFGYTQS